MNETFPLQPPVVFAVGAAHIDRRGRSAAPFLHGASNPGQMVETVGGSVFNAIRAARILPSTIRLVSPRGGDREATTVEHSLEGIGVEDIAMTWLDRRTPTYTALLDNSGDLVGGLADMQLYDMMRPRIFDRWHIRQALSEADIVLLDANLPVPTIERLVERAAERPVFAIGVSPAKVARLLSVLPYLAAIFVSRSEATQLAGSSGTAAMSEIAGHLIEAGCSRAVVTDGPRPAAVVEDGAVLWQMPTSVLSIQDVTGAGDTLAGIAMMTFANGSTFLEAARLGIAAASLHVSRERGDGALVPVEIHSLAEHLPAAASRYPDQRTDSR